MKELFQDYQRRDESDAVVSLNAVLTDLHNQCALREVSVKQLIQGTVHLEQESPCDMSNVEVHQSLWITLRAPGLSSQADTAETASAYPERAAAHSHRLAALESDMVQQKQGIQQMADMAR